MVEISYAALGDHGFDLAVHGVGQVATEVDFVLRGVDYELAGEEELVGFACVRRREG